MSKEQTFRASLIAEAAVREIRKQSIGALIYSPGEVAISALADELVERMKHPFRLAILGGEVPGKTAGTPPITFSVTEANRWQQDAAARKGTKLIVVVLGHVSKLPSLASSLERIDESKLRRTLAERAIGWLDTPGRRHLWTHLSENSDDFPFGALVRFAATADEVRQRSGKQDLPEYENRFLHLLGLMRQQSLFECIGAVELRRLVQNNLRFVAQLRSLEGNELRLVTGLADEGNADEKIRNIARNVLQLVRRRDNAALEKLDLNDVATLLKAKAEKKKNEDPKNGSPRKEKINGDEAAIGDFLRTGGKHLQSLGNVFDENDDDDEGDHEVKIDDRILLKRSRIGSAQVHPIIERLFTETVFGGIIRSESAVDHIDCLKLFGDGETDFVEFTPLATDKNEIQGTLDQAAKFYSVPENIGDAWQAYLAARARLLGKRQALADHPLLAMMQDEGLFKLSGEVVKTFGVMMHAISDLRTIIADHSPEASKRLISKALALDIVFVHSGETAVAIAGPTHPFHLWRWVEIARLLRAHRNEFIEIGEDVILEHAANPPVSSPHVLLSGYVDNSGKTRPFIGIGSLGALPLYGDPESRSAARFQAKGMADLALRFIKMSPYGELGFEVVAIDPPSVAELLDALLSVNDGRRRLDYIPVHLRVFRTRPAPMPTDEEDLDMEQVAIAVRECRGSLEIDPQPRQSTQITEALKSRAAHFALMFEPGDAQAFRVGIEISPTLSPLVIPRSYTYDPMEDQFDVVMVGNSTPFGAYYDLFREILNLPMGNTIGRRSGASRWIPRIAEMGQYCMWFALVDQGIEPTLRIPRAVRLDKRTIGGRDVHTFTSHPERIVRYAEKIVESSGLVPDELTTERALRLMRRLGGDTIPLAVSTAPINGAIVSKQARGLMGVLAVTAWHEAEAPNALLVSLDSEASRRWILGANEEDGRRGDLLCIRQTKAGLHLEVIEVKAWEDEQAAYRSVPTKEGSKVEGIAIGQIDCTLRILTRIMGAGELTGVDRARREMLRDQLYMAVAHRDLKPDERAKAVQLLDQFFREGATSTSGRLFLVKIIPGAERKYPSKPTVSGQSPDKHSVEVFELVETDNLARNEPPPDVPPPAGSGKPKEPVPTGPKQASPSPANKSSQRPSESKQEPSKIPEPTTKEGVSLLIGHDPTGKEIRWNSAENSNFGLLVTGDSGNGKSQTIRAIISDVRREGLPVLIFDFKNDYADAAFTNETSLTVYDVVRNGLPFNPLTLLPDEKGEVHPIRHCYNLAAIISRVEGLKQQQEARLVEALRHAYERHGIDPKSRMPVDEIVGTPDFDDVLEELEEMDDTPSSTALARLRKFSDLGLFPTKEPKISFEQLVNSGVVLTLNDANNPTLMQILAEIMIVKLHALMKRGDQPRQLRRLLVFDEAWRIAASEQLVDLAREGRAFGVGVVVGTQFPKDMPENLVGNLRTQIYLHNKDADNQKAIVRALCNATSGPHATRLLQSVANLGRFQGYLINEEYRQGVRVNIFPHKDRKPS